MAKKLFAIVFILNYIIMGLARYYTLPFPVSVTMELGFILLIAFIAADKTTQSSDWKRVATPCLGIYSIWLFYGLFQIANNTCMTGLEVEAWFRDYRNVCILMLYPMIIYPLFVKDMKRIHWLLVLWGILTIAATVKGYWQRNRGFDPYEWQWLMTYGSRTHLISTGVRYFSFFTDAANYGCHMAATMVVYGIIGFAEKNKKRKLFYLFIMACAGYSMLISGTRSAILVAGFGIAFYMFLSKNFKMFTISGIAFLVVIGGLRYTQIGDSNRLIHRMRTAFDPNDPSKAVRDNNKKQIAQYMDQAPLGIGLGRDRTNVPLNNRYYVVAVTPPDSTQIYIWVHTGVIGLWIYMGVMIALMVGGSIIVLTKIKNKELRNILAAMTVGFGSMIIAGYGNQVTTQYPNNLIYFGAIALVFSGIYIDRELTQKKLEEEKALLQEPTKLSKK